MREICPTCGRKFPEALVNPEFARLLRGKALTYSSLTLRSGVTPSTITNFLAGKGTRIDTVEKIAGILDLPIGDLLALRRPRSE